MQMVKVFAWSALQNECFGNFVKTLEVAGIKLMFVETDLKNKKRIYLAVQTNLHVLKCLLAFYS